MEELGLFGRTVERSELLRLVSAAAAGRGGVALVGGRLGMGKTALVEQVRRDAPGATWIVARCEGRGGGARDAPWRQAIASYVACGGDGPTQGPMAVVIEDLHLADDAALKFVAGVAQAAERLPLALLVTYRLDAVTSDHPLQPLLADLEGGGARHLLLRPLTAGEVQEMAVRRFGQELAEEVWEEAARWAYARSGGLPPAAALLLEAAAREGPAAAEAHLEGLALTALAPHLPPLGEDEMVVLQAAAAVGRGATPAVLAALTGLPPGRVGDALVAASRWGLLRPGARVVRFCHPLVGMALVADVPPTRRSIWHWRLAEAALGGGGEGAEEEAAYHLERTQDPAALGLMVAVADRMAAGGRRERAVELYARVLSLLGPTEEEVRAELHLKLGAWGPGGATARLSHWRQAQASGSAAVSTWARYLLLQEGENERDAADAAADLVAQQEALASDPRYRRLEGELFGSVSSYPRAGPLRVHLLTKAGNLDGARALLAALGRRAPSPWDAALLEASMVLAFVAGDLGGAAEMCGRAADLTYAAGDVVRAVHLKVDQLITFLAGRALPASEVDAVAATVARWEREAGEELLLPGYSLLGVYQYYRGEMALARRNLVDLSAACLERGATDFAWHAARMLLDVGDPAGALRFIEHVPPRSPTGAARWDSHLLLLVHALRAETYLALGRDEDARRWLDAARASPLLSQASFLRSVVSLVWGLYHRRRGDPERAERFALEALMAAEETPSSLAAIRSLRLLGELAASAGRRQKAERRFALALERAQRCRFPFEAAQVRFARERALGKGGSGLEASRLEVEAYVRAARGAGAGGAAGDCALEAGLTERQREIAQLVAAGLTDRQIADRLGISVRTVDHHMRNIFNRLGVTNRAALAAYATRRSLVD
jgi:DNA-binding CsgD family transcriptional regulator